jgi:hypothetical protein
MESPEYFSIHIPTRWGERRGRLLSILAVLQPVKCVSDAPEVAIGVCHDEQGVIEGAILIKLGHHRSIRRVSFGFAAARHDDKADA